MSRIEKGSQRFRPTVVSRRTAQADGNSHTNKPDTQLPARSAEPAPVVPGARRAPAPGNTPATSARSYAFAPSAAPRKIVPQKRDTGVTDSQPAVSSIPERSKEEARAPPAPRTTSLVPPVRASSVPISRPVQPSQSADGFGHFLQAAQPDPTTLQLDPALPADAVGAQASSAWQAMGETERQLVAQPRDTGSSAGTRRSNRASAKRRTATSISDDEAEYNAQCAAVSSPSVAQPNALPPLRVDVGATTMESIAVTNWRSGRASSRTFELERVRQRQLKKRRKDAEAIKENPSQSPAPEVIKESGTPAPDTQEVTEAPTETPAPNEEFGENRFAVQTRIVDGKIVLDERSLYADYRDEEQQAREQRNWEVVDEREGDQFVNSASRSKQRRTQRWSVEETERFFHAVSQWGTDFEMITRLFPHRTRREIKSKWTKESRQNPKRLDDAFTRRTAVDLKAYGHAAGVDLSGPPPVIEPKVQEVRPMQKDETT